MPGCDKRFKLRSSLRSHCASVHGVYGSSSCGDTPTDHIEDQSTGALREEGPPRFQCRLDGCATNSDFNSGTGKPLPSSALKAHQKKFHEQTLRGLERKFATLISNTGGADAALSIMDDEQRELWRYFEGLYRNCNKGIKGRGKGRKVAA